MRLAWVSFPARLSSAGSPTQPPPCPSSSQSTETRRCFSVPRSSCTQDWESTLCAAGVLTRGVIAVRWVRQRAAFGIGYTDEETPRKSPHTPHPVMRTPIP